MRVRSRITDPAPGSVLPNEPFTIHGKARSGSGPITSVDVSLAGEAVWYPASLEPPKGPYQWQDWTFEW